jgi:hypothetical protein
MPARTTDLLCRVSLYSTMNQYLLVPSIPLCELSIAYHNNLHYIRKAVPTLKSAMIWRRMGSRGKAPWIFNLHNRWRWVVSVTVGLFCLWGKIPGTTGQEAGWAPERAFTRHWRKLIASAKNRTQLSDLPAHSQVPILTVTSGFTVHLVILLMSSFPFCFVCSSLRCNTSKNSDLTCWGLPTTLFLYFTPLPVPPTRLRTFPRCHLPW